jgi:hypothetical protein
MPAGSVVQSYLAASVRKLVHKYVSEQASITAGLFLPQIRIFVFRKTQKSIRSPSLNLHRPTLQCRSISSSCEVRSAPSYDAPKGLSNALSNALS